MRLSQEQGLGQPKPENQRTGENMKKQILEKIAKGIKNIKAIAEGLE